MTYEVNCSIYWYDFLYDFVMLHVCYIYCDILNYDVIILHHTYSYINYQFWCIHFEINLHDLSTFHTFNNIIHNSYLCKLQNVEISMIMYYHEHHDDYKFIVMWFIEYCWWHTWCDMWTEWWWWERYIICMWWFW